MDSIIVGIIDLFLLVGLIGAILDAIGWIVRRNRKRATRRKA